MRCGRYYLGVWTFDETSFKIAPEQQPEFHQKMQAELRYCIYEENLKNKDKIIILFKMCLLALKKFDVKRINALNEIKRILMTICKQKHSSESMDPATDKRKQLDPNSLKNVGGETQQEKVKFPYDDKTKTLLFIGTKIFHEAIIAEDANNKTEILTMNGVEIMSDIASFILANTFKTFTTKREGRLGSDNHSVQHMSIIQENNIEDSVVLEEVDGVKSHPGSFVNTPVKSLVQD